MKKIFKNVLALSTISIAGIHVANCIIEDSSTNKKILTTRNGHYYNWKYGKIFYTKEGKGSPVLLLHNLTPDSSGYEWIKIKNQLSKEHTIYTLDILGCGRSEKPELTYTNYLFVQMVLDFITTIIKEKTDLVVSGRSSTFVIMSNLMNKELFGKIILINPSNVEEKNEKIKNSKKVSKLIMEFPVLGTYCYNVLMRKTLIKNQCTNDYCSKQYYVTKDMIDAYYESAHLNKSKGRFLFASLNSKYTNTDIRKALSSITNSILIIESEEEFNNQNLFEQYKQYNSSIQGKTIKDTTCLPHIEKPKKTCDIINEFLN